MSGFHPRNVGYAVRRQVADIGHGARLFSGCS